MPDIAFAVLLCPWIGVGSQHAKLKQRRACVRCTCAVFVCDHAASVSGAAGNVCLILLFPS